VVLKNGINCYVFHEQKNNENTSGDQLMTAEFSITNHSFVVWATGQLPVRLGCCTQFPFNRAGQVG
jgi:hypothetical protein